MANAPNYRPSDTNERCGTCRYSEEGRCTLYDMEVEPSYTCDSWVSAEEAHAPVDASVMKKHSGVTLMGLAEKTAEKFTPAERKMRNLSNLGLNLRRRQKEKRAVSKSALPKPPLKGSKPEAPIFKTQLDKIHWTAKNSQKTRKRHLTDLKRRARRSERISGVGSEGVALRRLKRKPRDADKTVSLTEKRAMMQGPPKARRASRQMMHQMLELLLGMYLLYYELHWKYHTRYGDHLLFERMYKQVQEELDGLAEKLIGYHGSDELELIELVEGANSYIKLWTKDNEDFIGQGLKAENALQTLFHKNYDELKKLNALPMGFDDYIMAVCNDHETHTYLLQQVRAGRGKEKTAMPSKKDILKALAIGGGGAALGAGGGYVAGHRTGMARDKETPYSGRHMQFAYVKGQQDLARRLRAGISARRSKGKEKKAASRKALAGTALASLLAGGGAGYVGGRVHGKKIDEKTPFASKHVQFAYTKGQHDLAQRLRAAVATRQQAMKGKTKQAMISIPAGALAGAAASEKGQRGKGALLGAAGGLGGAVLGGIPFALVAPRLRNNPKALAATILGGEIGGGALGGYLAGRAARKSKEKKASKVEYSDRYNRDNAAALAALGQVFAGSVGGAALGGVLAEEGKGHRAAAGGLLGGLGAGALARAVQHSSGRRFPNAAQIIAALGAGAGAHLAHGKSKEKKAAVEDLVEYAFNEELEAIAQG